MNNKKGIKKGVIGIALAAIMIASIFAVIAPTGVGTEPLVKPPGLSKVSELPLYEIGDTINYTMEVCNPETEYSMTLNITDIQPDQYPAGTPITLDTKLVLEPGDCKTYKTQYVVDADDIIGGYVWNVFKAEGKNNKTVPEVIKSEAELNTPIRLECTFDFDFEDACCKLIRFTGTSTGDVINHTWDFGDGETETHDGRPEDHPVVHDYSPDCENFTVTLSGWCAPGVSNVSSPQVVYVDCGPTADAKANITCFEKPGAWVKFDGSSSTNDTRPIVSYEWEFSDGDSKTGKIVEKFISEETTATLTVNDSHCEDTDYVMVIVCAECKLRLYGTFDAGPGDHSVIDDETGLPPENKPYTDPMGPFDPQHEQAPEKDFITFNPAIMDSKDGDYDELKSAFIPCGGGTAVEKGKEKVFKRMWYEKEWFKDHDKDGCWDVVIDKYNPITKEYEYNQTMCIEEWNDIPEWVKVTEGLKIREHNDDPTLGDLYGPAIKQEFAYMFLDDTMMPMMIQNRSKVLIPMSHDPDKQGRGLNSFDADINSSIDGDRDALRVESEATLGMDIDHDGKYERMDNDTIELNGNESVVLVLGNKWLNEGDEIQFFDHRVELKSVFQIGDVGHAIFDVYNNEGGNYTGKTSNVQMQVDGVEYFMRGTQPIKGQTFYIKLLAADADNDIAIIEVGRMFGQTHANIGANIYWSQKAFIVDEVFYNVVAIKAEDDCIKYIVFREKLPKMPIELHGTDLKVWKPCDILPEMPPFNEDHYVIVDVQQAPPWTKEKMGDKELRPALKIHYNKEGEEMRYKGELKEIYNETLNETCYDECIGAGKTPEECWDECCKEFWMLEWFHTQPQQYTEFALPADDKYLVTLSWYAPQSDITIWNGMGETEPVANYTGERVKFWYEDCTGPLYIDRANSSIRLYGTFDAGPGDHTATDPEPGPSYGLKPENPPYTDPVGPFYPQHEQAPRKDFITFNPAIMDYKDGYTDLEFTPCDGGTSVQREKEKVFKRMWYEKEWFKDHNENGCWDVVIDKYNPITKEYEYNQTMCIEEWNDIPEWVKVTEGLKIREHNDDTALGDLYGPAIKQEFAYMFLDDNMMPIMVQSPSKVLIPMAHDPEKQGRGLNSFDADGDPTIDGDRDALRVESETTLGMDIDHDGKIERMDNDTIELNGNESVVLVLGDKWLNKEDVIQFFDHRVELKAVFQIGDEGHAIFNVYNNEGGGYTGKTSNVQIPVGGVEYFMRGTQPTKGQTFYLKLLAADADNDIAIIEVGRMFGQTHANIGANPYWSQKAFIVDEVFYNVVAIKAKDDCIKYIVFREKLPKMPIELHGTDLKVWEPCDILPEMSPFNEEHEIIEDVQPTWTRPYSQQDKIGDKKTRPPLKIHYFDEGEEMRFKGELKEIYGETIDCECECEEKEYWMLEWFHTKPQQYTAFVLPEDGGLYLVTLGWYAPESEITIWDADPDGPIANYTGERVKFLYDPADNTDLYVNRKGDAEPPVPPTIAEYYDRVLNGGDGGGDVDLDEVINAILDYLHDGEPFPMPPGLFIKGDLIDYVLDYLHSV